MGQRRDMKIRVKCDIDHKVTSWVGFAKIFGALEGGCEVARGQFFWRWGRGHFFSICEVTKILPEICEVNFATRSRSLSNYLRGHTCNTPKLARSNRWVQNFSDHSVHDCEPADVRWTLDVCRHVISNFSSVIEPQTSQISCQFPNQLNKNRCLNKTLA